MCGNFPSKPKCSNVTHHRVTPLILNVLIIEKRQQEPEDPIVTWLHDYVASFKPYRWFYDISPWAIRLPTWGNIDFWFAPLFLFDQYLKHYICRNYGIPNKLYYTLIITFKSSGSEMNFKSMGLSFYPTARVKLAQVSGIIRLARGLQFWVQGQKLVSYKLKYIFTTLNHF